MNEIKIKGYQLLESDDKALLNLCPAKQSMVGTETKKQKALCKM